MEIFMVVVGIICAVYTPFWAYGIITNKDPVRTDCNKLDKVLVTLFVVNLFCLSVVRVLEYFAL